MAAKVLTDLGERQINHTLFRQDIYFKCDSDTSFAVTVLPRRIDGEIICVDTWPGSTAPQNSYDPVLKNAEGVDVMGTALADRSSTLVQRAWPLSGAGGTIIKAPVEACLSLTITGNNVAAADGYLSIYYKKRQDERE